MAKIQTRHDICGASYIQENGAVCGVYRRCPHCGMVDHHYSAQGASKAHHQITRVGAILQYECGGCRKRFHAVEISIPANTTPQLFYDKLCKLLLEGEDHA